MKRRTDPNFYIDQTEEFDKLNLEDQIDIVMELFGETREEVIEILKKDREERGLNK